MSESANEPTLAVVQERIDSPSRFSIYCNSVEMGVSPWDVRMILMELLGNKDNRILAEVHGTVVMSPAHAKMFLEALQRTIKTYEEQFGEIDVSKIREALTNPSSSLP